MGTAAQQVDHWLDTATRGLPPDVAAMTRAELLAHLEDAMDDYVETGMDEVAARQRALADLGAAEATGRGLNDVHRGQAHYRRALVASLLMTGLYLVIPMLPGLFGWTYAATGTQVLMFAATIIFFIPTVYVLHIMQRLLSWRFRVAHVEWLVPVIVVGLGIEIGETLLSQVIFGYDAYTDVTRTLAGAASALDSLLILVAWGSHIVVGLALIALAVQILRAAANLYGLAWPLALATGLLGFTLASVPTLAHLGQGVLVYLLYHVNLAAHALIWPVLALLFLRALYRTPTNQPVRFA
ncbi:MAG: hypothetical protein JW910_11120 [Anaerolineae bacterium]|nr:hypothetical protein [Anaerolineae bacterium]